MIPKSLNEWSIPVIINLLVQGYYETEFFDFKEMLPHSKNEDEKTRLYKSCCAFANSFGGVLVFGVKDNKSLPPKDRLVGFDAAFDFPEHFGSYPNYCNPSVKWDFLNPPLQLDTGNVIHVVEIPRSWNAPHCIEISNQKGSDMLRCFSKRTNKGNEDMSYQEIRLSFLQYYEKRLKLQLLKSELQNIQHHAQGLSNSGFGIGDLRLNVLETVLADTYTILADNQELLTTLDHIRNACNVVNGNLQVSYRVFASQNFNKEGLTRGFKQAIDEQCSEINYWCSRALELLTKVLSLS
jgi:hypothetical protein